MAGLAAVLTGLAYYRNPQWPLMGWKIGAQLFLTLLPMLFFALIVSGLVQILVPKEVIGRWLGTASGWRGIMLGSVAGAFTPGGPYTSFPIVAVLYKSGAGIGTLVAYLTAWSIWAVARLPMEMALINTRFVWIRLASTFFFPPLAGLIAHVFFSRYFR